MIKKILFLLGSANLSGGTYVILQHAQFLKKMGFDVTVALVFMKFDEYLVLKDSKNCWHPAIKELNFIPIEYVSNQEYDLAIFTWWATVFYYEQINAKSFVYFVQSIESRFYPKEETFSRQLVERSYKLGLPVVTEAKWIQRYLQTNYNNECGLARNGILKSLYTCNGPAYAEKSSHQLRVLVEGPLNTSYKNVAKTIELCRAACVGEVWLLTSTAVVKVEGVDRIFSQVAIEDVPAIYRSCDVLVKLSYVEGMFGPPLEMFHCGGTAIVYDVTGHDEYIIHDHNALVVKKDDEYTVVTCLKKLSQDRSLLSRLIAGAKATAEQWVDWSESSSEFLSCLESKLCTPFTTQQKLILNQNFNKFKKEYIDIVIVKNNVKSRQQLEANAVLSATGYYSLIIPIKEGPTQIGVLFGKNYKSFIITKAELKGIGKAAPKGDFTLLLAAIVRNPNGVFVAQSDSGAIVFNANIMDMNNLPNAEFILLLEFQPLALPKHKSIDYEAAIAASCANA